jgi:hypothetical protein
MTSRRGLFTRKHAVCSSSVRAAPAGGRPRPGRPLPASYVPGPVPNRPSTYSLCASPLAHARRRRCQPGWSPWPRSASRPTNQRRSAVRCARGLRPPFSVSSRNPLSPRGPPLRRPLVVVPRLTVSRFLRCMLLLLLRRWDPFASRCLSQPIVCIHSCYDRIKAHARSRICCDIVQPSSRDRPSSSPIASSFSSDASLYTAVVFASPLPLPLPSSLPPPPPPLSPLPPQSKAVALASPRSRSLSDSRSRVVGQWRRCMSVDARGPPAALRAVGVRVTPERVKGAACAMVTRWCAVGTLTPQCSMVECM